MRDISEVLLPNSLAYILERKKVKQHRRTFRHAALGFTEKISTGLRSLDRAMKGGIGVGSLTGFIGAFGSGKSQLCHQLAVMVQLPVEEGGLASGAVYVDTEGDFRPERLAAMAEYRGLDPQHALENTIYIRTHEYLMLRDVLEILSRKSLEFKLLIIDSLAAPVRAEFYNKPRHAAYELYRLVNFLSDLAFRRRVAVVLTDQVTQPPDEAPRGYGGWVLAGVQHLLWFDKLGFGRILVRLLKSPSLRSFEVQARITGHGVVDVEAYI